MFDSLPVKGAISSQDLSKFIADANKGKRSDEDLEMQGRKEGRKEGR